MRSTPPIPLALSELHTSDLGREGTTFSAGGHLYVATGRVVGRGGTGTALLARRHGTGVSESEEVVLKVLSEDVLWRFRYMPVLGAHFEHNCQVLGAIDRVGHPNLLPHYLAQPIADNFLVVRPMAHSCLSTFVLGRAEISLSDRLGLFIDALEGLAALHRHGIVHGDFTLRNVAVRLGAGLSPQGFRIAVFDFDQSVAPALLPPKRRSYRAYYDGYLVGCPQFSTTPEVVDDDLGGEPISARGDVYAAGAALYTLLTEEPLYGACDDIEEIQRRIQRGLVRGSACDVRFPESFPRKLRPTVERCLQRHPRDRFADASEVLGEIRRAVEVTAPHATVPAAVPTHCFVKSARHEMDLRQAFEKRPDPSLGAAQFQRAAQAIAASGYRIERCLHRVRGHGVFVVRPEPDLLAAGQFVDRNDFRKVVTAIDLAEKPDGDAYARSWIREIRPIVERVRQKHLTPLYRVVHDTGAGQLLLFTEYVADVRFGTDLLAHEIPVRVTLALAVELAEPLRLLHGAGLAHNNVGLGSLMLKANREGGTVQPLLAGLVEPTTGTVAREEDVRCFAGLLGGLLARARQGACCSEGAGVLVGAVADTLGQVARHEMVPPPVEILAARAGDALAALDPTFAVVRQHRGDTFACAALLSHPFLYHLLFR